MEMQQSRRLQNDGRAQNTRWAHHKRAQSSDDSVEDTQVGSAFPPTIEDQQLMAHENGFSNDGTDSARPWQAA